MAITGIFVMFGPFVFQIITNLIHAVPPDFGRTEYELITYIGGFFFTTGLLMLIYVAIYRFNEGRKE